MPNGVTKETFEYADTDSKLNILFDQQLQIVDAISNLQKKNNNRADNCFSRWSECDTRFKKLEKSWYKLTGAVLLLVILGPVFSEFIINFFL